MKATSTSKIEEKFDMEFKQWININSEKSINVLNYPQILVNMKTQFKELLRRIKIFHDKSIAHYDIKPENIMVMIDKKK